uniref:Amino acid transporter transmembrane domain-containing protein n=1 Tax=Kalanchoe fedtschenkoi TaxID=63787 RepID=A0A7N0UFE6_KALFE
MSPLLPARKPDSDSRAPLLPHLSSSRKDGSGGGTVPGAVFNVTTSIIGAGIMSIPATVKVLGVFPALAIIVTVATLADVSVEFLMRFTHSGETTTYAGVMREAFGPIGALAVQMAVLFTNLGCLIIYLIIIGKREVRKLRFRPPPLVKDDCRFISLTFALLALSYLASIAIPDIWYFFQFVGSTSAVCLAFIFPGAIVLRDRQGVATRKDRMVAVVMIVLAVVTSTIAIYSNVYSLLGGGSSS